MSFFQYCSFDSICFVLIHFVYFENPLDQNTDRVLERFSEAQKKNNFFFLALQLLSYLIILIIGLLEFTVKF